MRENTVTDGPDTLPEGFRFSQSSLQDFTDCRRRFQLRYIYDFRWPAVESEPVLEHEKYLQQGIALHHAIHQVLSGVPKDFVEPFCAGSELQQWWSDFVRFADQEEILGHSGGLPEYSLSAGLGDYRLVAKYDFLIKKSSGEYFIYDWKTSRRIPDRKLLADRIQTRLYPYLLVQAGSQLTSGSEIDPAKISIAYWYTSFPDQAVAFRYSQEKLAADHAFFEQLLQEIVDLPPGKFHQTSNERRCAYCVFRSFCERGVQAGLFTDLFDQPGSEDLSDVQLDFDEVPIIDL